VLKSDKMRIISRR